MMGFSASLSLAVSPSPASGVPVALARRVPILPFQGEEEGRKRTAFPSH